MSQIKIASVSYLNSVQFVYGIQESHLIDAELIIAPPSECSQMMRSGDVDIALIPVASLPSLNADVEEDEMVDAVTGHCIGSLGAVRSVALLSDEKLEDIERIWLDPHSQTSVRLLAHLAEHHFKISPEWHILKDMERLKHPEDGDAFLLIGDKVFDYEGEFEYITDLGEEWMRHTSMPFVYAVWCARRSVSEDIINDLEDALTWGVEHTFEALRALRPEVDMEDGYRYLTENIDTLFDSAKQAAMERFLESKSKISFTR